jgi:hypothetical protein
MLCILCCSVLCSRVNAGMTEAHRKLYQAATAGNLPAYLEQVEEVKRLFIITYLQVGCTWLVWASLQAVNPAPLAWLWSLCACVSSPHDTCTACEGTGE